MPASSSTLSTPTWAKPRAPPPPSTNAIRGRSVLPVRTSGSARGGCSGGGSGRLAQPAIASPMTRTMAAGTRRFRDIVRRRGSEFRDSIGDDARRPTSSRSCLAMNGLRCFSSRPVYPSDDPGQNHRQQLPAPLKIRGARLFGNAGEGGSVRISADDGSEYFRLLVGGAICEPVMTAGRGGGAYTARRRALADALSFQQCSCEGEPAVLVAQARQRGVGEYIEGAPARNAATARQAVRRAPAHRVVRAAMRAEKTLRVSSCARGGGERLIERRRRSALLRTIQLGAIVV